MEDKILQYIQVACRGDCDDCIDAKPDPCVHGANQILRIIIEDLDNTIRGKYPQGNTYSDQMERVTNLLDIWRGAK